MVGSYCLQTSKYWWYTFTTAYRITAIIPAMLCVSILIYYIRIEIYYHSDVVILRILVCLLQRLYSTFQMIATTLLLLLLLSQTSLVTGARRKTPLSIERRTEAKLYCIDKYARCLRMNRCHIKKNKTLKRICERNYTECMKFYKVMFERLDANDFVARRWLNMDGW